MATDVHSTWRYTHATEELRDVQGALGTRFVGAIPRGPRYESIVRWLHMNLLFRSYRILDDDPAEFPIPPPSELIVYESQTGVEASAV